MEASTTSAATDVVVEFYRLLGEGKLEDGLALLDDDVVIHHSTDLPYGREYRGKADFQQLIGTMFGMVDAKNLTEIEYTAAGEHKCILRMRAEFTGRESGRSGQTDILEYLTVRDGKIVDWDIYYRTPSAVAAAVEEA